MSKVISRTGTGFLIQKIEPGDDDQTHAIEHAMVTGDFSLFPVSNSFYCRSEADRGSGDVFRIQGEHAGLWMDSRFSMRSLDEAVTFAESVRENNWPDRKPGDPGPGRVRIARSGRGEGMSHHTEKPNEEWSVLRQAAAIIEALVRGNYSLLPWSAGEYRKDSEIPADHLYLIQELSRGVWLDSKHSAPDLETIMGIEAEIMRAGWPGRDGRDPGETRIVKIRGRWRV